MAILGIDDTVGTNQKARVFNREEEQMREKHLIVCPYCSVGCRMYVETEDGYPVGIEYVDDIPGIPNKGGKLCPKGNVAFQYAQSKDRLTRPLKKVAPGKFQEISWQEAMDEVAGRMNEIKGKHGPGALAFLGSEKCSVEDNYLIQKLARAMGSNNVEFAGRLCQSSNVVARTKILGSAPQTNPSDDVLKADVVVLWGYNPAATNPVFFGQYVEKAVLDNGAKLIAVDAVKTQSAKYADIYLQPYPGTDLAIILAMINYVIENDLYDKDFVAKRVEGFGELAKTVEEYTPKWAEKISGVPANLIEGAARTVATGGKTAVLANEGLNQHVNGTAAMMALTDLVLITGNIGKEGVMSGAIPGAFNGMGASLTGVNCAQLPGAIPVADEEERERIERAWGLEIPDKPGLHYVAMFGAAYEGSVKALYIMGQNPARSLPDSAFVEKALEKAEFVVAQDIFPTETTKYADIVLPAAAWHERAGTAISSNRRVQWSFKAADAPGEAKPDWEILVGIANALGLGKYFYYSSIDDVLSEINKVIPALKGATPQRLRDDLKGCMFPCSDEKSETPRLFLKGFPTPSGKANLIAPKYIPPGEIPDDEYSFWLSNFRLVGHFHTGTMSFRSKSLEDRWAEGFVYINDQDARKLKVNDGDLVKVETRRSSLTAKVEVTPYIKKGVISMPWHWGFNLLTKDAVDNLSKIPGYKTAACKISKVRG